MLYVLYRHLGRVPRVVRLLERSSGCQVAAVCSIGTGLLALLLGAAVPYVPDAWLVASCFLLLGSSGHTDLQSAKYTVAA